jgi:hypothetical protein
VKIGMNDKHRQERRKERNIGQKEGKRKKHRLVRMTKKREKHWPGRRKERNIG